MRRLRKASFQPFWHAQIPRSSSPIDLLLTKSKRPLRSETFLEREREYLQHGEDHFHLSSACHSNNLLLIFITLCRKINCGEIIYREKPLIVMPQRIFDDDDPSYIELWLDRRINRYFKLAISHFAFLPIEMHLRVFHLQNVLWREVSVLLVVRFEILLRWRQDNPGYLLHKRHDFHGRFGSTFSHPGSSEPLLCAKRRLCRKRSFRLELEFFFIAG